MLRFFYLFKKSQRIYGDRKRENRKDNDHNKFVHLLTITPSPTTSVRAAHTDIRKRGKIGNIS